MKLNLSSLRDTLFENHFEEEKHPVLIIPDGTLLYNYLSGGHFDTWEHFINTTEAGTHSTANQFNQCIRILEEHLQDSARSITAPVRIYRLWFEIYPKKLNHKQKETVKEVAEEWFHKGGERKVILDFMEEDYKFDDYESLSTWLNYK